MSAMVIITSIIGDHNHQMQPDVMLYAPKYRRLSPEILEMIEFYVTKGNMAGAQSTQRIEVMNKLIKDGVKATSSLHNLHDHIQNLLDNKARLARHNRYLNSIPTHQVPLIVESIFPKVFEILRSYLTPHILAVQQQQIIESLLYKVQLRQNDDIQALQEATQLDYDSGFLEDELHRPQISIMTLIKNIEPNEIVEIWELMGLAAQNINISTTLQQNDTEMLYLDLHIIEHIRGATYSALNIALDLGCEDELISMITQFVEQKKTILEGSNNENTQFNQFENITVNDPLVTKHRGRPPTKRLKSSSETQDHTGLTHSNHAINPQDPNLRIPLSNISSNNSATIEESKRKYVCNVCGEVSDAKVVITIREFDYLLIELWGQRLLTCFYISLSRFVIQNKRAVDRIGSLLNDRKLKTIDTR
ncbi:11974_t:CDS:2, partial [Gigaspora rosea]